MKTFRIDCETAAGGMSGRCLRMYKKKKKKIEDQLLSQEIGVVMSNGGRCHSCFFPLLSFFLFLLDMVLDTWAIVSLCQQKKYFAMGLFFFFLLASSVLLQIFSWLWYSESPENPKSRVEKFVMEHRLLALVHVLQLGVFVRFVLRFR